MNDKPVYTLNEIALWAQNNEVAIPNVQRGFVWKPAQIENLWDSLLRGYPVGAFVMTKKDNGTYEILDGQQRATSISLGFGTRTLRDAPGERIRVFIDIDPKLDEDDTRKYLFRVITKSHPWGYQKNDTSKTLIAQNIRNALNNYYNGADPTIDSIDKFYPWDAEFPVPFKYFIIAEDKKQSKDQLWDELKKWELWNVVYNKWKNSNDNDENYERIAKNKIFSIYEAVKRMLDISNGQKVPALYLKLDDWLDNDEVNSKNDDAPDEIENLFVRLNAGGTQLAGEELNYSILKAHIDKNTQDVLESACEQLFKPARFITVAYRLYQQNKKLGQADGLTMRIKPKQFQRSFSKKVEVKQFENFLISICNDKIEGDYTLISYVRKVLAYHANECPYGLPFLLYSKISNDAPELMFMLMYRIKFKNDRFHCHTEESKVIHKRMLGMITLMMWFGRGDNLRDHSKLLSQIWLSVSNLNETNRFWSFETIQRARMNNILNSFPNFFNKNNGSKEIGIESILQYKITSKKNVLETFEEQTKPEYKNFLQRCIDNRDLLIYAQRHFIEAFFSSIQYRQDDTAVPFDWDHIYPSSYVYNRRNIEQVLKNWYNTIGNFRVWPYSLNRMDSDNSPAVKLKPLEIAFYQSYDEYQVKVNKWEEFIQRNQTIITNLNDIHTKLKEWSFCNDDWANSETTNLRNDWEPVLKLIINRNIDIIGEWYKNLNIEELHVLSNNSLFSVILDSSNWIKEDIGQEKKDEYFDNDEVVYTSQKFEINGTHYFYYIYIAFSESFILAENAINFGLKITEGPIFFDMNISSDDYRIIPNHNAIEKKFTLLSFNEYEINDLKTKLFTFINSIPFVEVPIDCITKNLIDSFVQKNHS